MCLKFCSSKKNSSCSCEDYNEYEIKLKCMKAKIHSRYIACIAAGIVIWLLATGQANTDEFSMWISFASTVTSIILSVIAIIMSITGESKTEVMRNQMEETAKKLDAVASELHEEMSGANTDIRELISQLDKQIKILQDKVDKVPEQVNQYKKTNKTYSNTKNRTTRNSGDWGSKNEKR